jgi:hypothetical protein
MERDRKAPCPCGSGKRYKSCCYARDRGLADARERGRAGLALVDGVLKVLLPLVESRGEYKIACGPGCNACCGNFVRCSLPEALLVADWLDEPEHHEVRARFLAKLPAWRAAGGEELQRLNQILDENGGRPTEGSAWDEYNRLGVRYGARMSMCPLNRDGKCEVYEVRPTICRSVHVLDTAENCVPGRDPPRVLTHPKLEEAVKESARSFSEASWRMGVGACERPLPEAVAWALASNAARR